MVYQILYTKCTTLHNITLQYALLRWPQIGLMPKKLKNGKSYVTLCYIIHVRTIQGLEGKTDLFDINNCYWKCKNITAWANGLWWPQNGLRAKKLEKHEKLHCTIILGIYTKHPRKNRFIPHFNNCYSKQKHQQHENHIWTTQLRWPQIGLNWKRQEKLFWANEKSLPQKLKRTGTVILH